MRIAHIVKLHIGRSVTFQLISSQTTRHSSWNQLYKMCQTIQCRFESKTKSGSHGITSFGQTSAKYSQAFKGLKGTNSKIQFWVKQAEFLSTSLDALVPDIDTICPLIQLVKHDLSKKNLQQVLQLEMQLCGSDDGIFGMIESYVYIAKIFLEDLLDKV